jgi:hypothetical protein
MPSRKPRSFKAAIRGTRSSRSQGWSRMIGAVGGAAERRRDLHLPGRIRLVPEVRIEALEIPWLSRFRLVLACDRPSPPRGNGRGPRWPGRSCLERRASDRAWPRGRRCSARRAGGPPRHAPGQIAWSSPRPPVVMQGVIPRAARARDDLQETLVQIGLAADEHHLARAQRGELVDDLERLVRRRARRGGEARARAAVRAGEIAAQRQLPDDVARVVGRVDDVEASPTGSATP